jgi:hypothetical protein
MIRRISVFTIILTLMGCASTSAPQRNELCAQAQMGYTLSVVMLENTLAPPDNAYWQLYKRGAAEALRLYCGAAADE